MINKVFLGGTCNGSDWREEFIRHLNVRFFNPVVPEWNDEARQKELIARANYRILLYAITPQMRGFYSIAEVVDDSNKNPQRTILLIIEKDGETTFSKHQLTSLNATAELVKNNGAKVFNNILKCAEYCNSVLQDH